MSDIFISYAKEGKPTAKLLADALERQNWSVWWDRNIPPGRSFDEVIEEALDSAKCVIVLWSKHSVSSDWVKVEAAEGAKRGILVPVLIEDVRIPLEFRRIQAANLSNWQYMLPHTEFDELLKSVSAKLSGTTTQEMKSSPISQAPESPSNLSNQSRVQKEWRSELIAESAFEKAIRVFLTHDVHVIDLKVHFFKPDVIRIDGDIVMKVPKPGEHMKCDLYMTDGPERYPATIEVSHLPSWTATWIEQIKLRLRIADRILYSDEED